MKILTDAELVEIRAELARRESTIYGLGHDWFTIKQLLDTLDALRSRVTDLESRIPATRRYEEQEAGRHGV